MPRIGASACRQRRHATPAEHFVGSSTSITGLLLLALLLQLLACARERPPEEEGTPTPAPGRSVATWSPTDREIAWKPWTASSFEEARTRDCPLLLYLASPGSEGLFTDDSSALRLLVEQRFIGMRVDPLRRPDIARRYPVGGWPALIALLPDGRSFATAVDIPAENVELFLLRLWEAYAEKREVIAAKVARAVRRATREPAHPIDPERIYQTCVETFDSTYAGFGRGTKFPEIATLEFLLAYAEAREDERARHMVERTLEALLTSPMIDARSGGVHAFSHTPDWQRPVREKDGLDQALLLQLLLAKADRDRSADTEAARRQLGYITAELFDPDRGAFRGRQLGVGAHDWWTDPLIYADRHAGLIRACVAAARQLSNDDARDMAQAAGEFLLGSCIDAEGAVQHVCGEPALSGLLEDQMLAGLALLDLGELSDEARFEVQARRLLHFAEAQLYDGRARAFADRPERIAVEGLPIRSILPYRDGMPPAGNPLAAELYFRLGDAVRGGQLLGGKRLVNPPGRSHSSAGRIALIALE